MKFAILAVTCVAFAAFNQSNTVAVGERDAVLWKEARSSVEGQLQIIETSSKPFSEIAGVDGGVSVDADRFNSVQLVTTRNQKPSEVLASWPFLTPVGEASVPSLVLAVLVEKGMVTFVFSRGGLISVFQFDLHGERTASRTFLRRWTDIAAMTPLQMGDVVVKIGREADKTLKIVVRDNRVTPKPTLRTFIQHKDCDNFRFDVVAK